VWVSQSDSRPFWFVYWFCIISRHASVSRSFPSFSGTSVGPVSTDAIELFVGPVKVELAGLAQLTENFQTWIAYRPQIEAK